MHRLSAPGQASLRSGQALHAAICKSVRCSLHEASSSVPWQEGHKKLLLIFSYRSLRDLASLPRQELGSAPL